MDAPALTEVESDERARVGVNGHRATLGAVPIGMAELPNPEQMQAFMARADDGPVVMLNLLKFKPDGGAESYAKYGEAVAPLLAKVGGRARYIGGGTELIIGRQDEDWDMVLLVEYPTRGALIAMASSAEYQAIQHLRDDSLTRSVLLATDPVELPG